MRKTLAIVSLIAILVALLGGSAVAATAVTARPQLRGHLPELGERPTTRVFVTQAEYDTYRNSERGGDADAVTHPESDRCSGFANTDGDHCRPQHEPFARRRGKSSGDGC